MILRASIRPWALDIQPIKSMKYTLDEEHKKNILDSSNSSCSVLRKKFQMDHIVCLSGAPTGEQMNQHWMDQIPPVNIQKNAFNERKQ